MVDARRTRTAAQRSAAARKENLRIVLLKTNARAPNASAPSTRVVKRTKTAERASAVSTARNVQRKKPNANHPRNSMQANAFVSRNVKKRFLCQSPKAMEAIVKAVKAKAVKAKAVEAKVVEAKVVEAKAVEAKVVEAKVVEAKVVKAKAAEAKVVEAIAMEAKVVEAKAAEAKAMEAAAI